MTHSQLHVHFSRCFPSHIPRYIHYRLANNRHIIYIAIYPNLWENYSLHITSSILSLLPLTTIAQQSTNIHRYKPCRSSISSRHPSKDTQKILDLDMVDLIQDNWEIEEPEAHCCGSSQNKGPQCYSYQKTIINAH